MTALAVEALAAVRAAGGDVKLGSAGRLKVVAPKPLADSLIERLRVVKPELIDLLSPHPDASLPSSTANWGEVEDERAAVIEIDCGAPRRWAEALARLNSTKPPADVPLQRWRRFIDDCGHFLDQGWDVQAIALGWTPLDLFGCDRERPFARIDQAGLLGLLNGRKLVALTSYTATTELPAGHRQTYQRIPLETGRVVLAWALI